MKLSLCVVFIISCLGRSAKAELCSDGSEATACAEMDPASNPDAGKDLWVISNAGGENNAGGGGLSGKKCEGLHPNCAECVSGFKSCDTCVDLSSEGGFAFEDNNGVCGILITFEELYTSRYASVPNGYKGMNWDQFGLVNKTWYATRFPNSGYVLHSSEGNFVGYNLHGHTASFSAPPTFTFSLKSMKLASAWANDNVVTVKGFDEAGNEVADASTTLALTTETYEMVFDEAFEDVFKVTIRGSQFQVAIDDIFVI